MIRGMPNVTTSSMRLSEVLGALSYALDLTEGQPAGHCLRSCWIGVQVARALRATPRQLHDTYYTILLKDLGCSSNAARICQLYLVDDRTFKKDFKTVGDSLPQVLRFVLSHTGMKADLAARFRAIVNVMQNGGEIANELIEARCQRGAQIARMMRFPTGSPMRLRRWMSIGTAAVARPAFAGKPFRWSRGSPCWRRSSTSSSSARAGARP
jgi:hypothetical protein